MTSLLIRNGALWSAGVRLSGDAVGIRDDRIVAIGEQAQVTDALGTADEVIDAHGALVHPSFADAHVHAALAGIEMRRCDLSGVATATEAFEAITRYAQASSGEWILGSGWALPIFAGGNPTREDLDAIVSDRPAYLINADHHGAWVNSRALQLAGVTADTVDPPDGRIERRSDGTPSGVLHEGAMDLVARLIPRASTAEVSSGLVSAARILNGFGVTAWQEALVGEFGEYPDVTAGYLDAIASGLLDARPSGALWVPRTLTAEGIDSLVAEFVERGAANAAAGFPTTTAKIMVDGIAENHTAAMHEQYCGHEDAGLTYFDPDLVQQLVVALNTAGIAAHFHAIGDRAVTDALDAVAAVPQQHRQHNHIAHLQVVQPSDRARFAELGVTVNAQALWACNERQMVGLTLPLLGEVRSGWQYPFGSLTRAGAALAMGSDWPVTTPDPWQAIHVAVNRQEPGVPDQPPLTLDEALDLDGALTAYTRGSHELLGQCDSGVLAVGARADIVVADRDPFEHPASEIYLTRARHVVFGGRLLDPT